MASELERPPSSSRRWIWTGLVLLLAGVFLAGVAWVRAQPAGETGTSVSPGALGEVPDFHLGSEDGRPFSRADLAGEPWVAGFIFTRCTTFCPKITARMLPLQGQVRLVSFTVDPEGDTPEILSQYAAAHGARAPGWRFLTGRREDLYRLISEGFKLSVAPNPDPSKGGDLITHSDRLILVDGSFRIRGTYSSSAPEAMERLRAALKALK